MRADISEIHRTALRAAAKLAFSATILGCGGAVASEAAAPEDKATDTTADLRKPRHDAGHHHDAATNVCGPTATVYQTREDCCATVVTKAYPDGGLMWSQNPAPGVSADVKTCCQVLASASDEKIKNNDPSGWQWPERGTCCAVLGWQGAATCTPWGPAVPPAMPGVA